MTYRSRYVAALSTLVAVLAFGGVSMLYLFTRFEHEIPMALALTSFGGYAGLCGFVAGSVWCVARMR